MTDPDVRACNVGDHDDLSTGPVEPGGDDSWGSVSPDERQPGRYCGLEQSLRQIGFEQPKVPLRQFLATFSLSRVVHDFLPTSSPDSVQPGPVLLKPCGPSVRHSGGSSETRRRVSNLEPCDVYVKTDRLVSCYRGRRARCEGNAARLETKREFQIGHSRCRVVAVPGEGF